MKFRLTTYITGILFLGVVVATAFASPHNPEAKHIDKGLAAHQEFSSRKIKKNILDPAAFSPATPSACLTLTLPTPAYEFFSLVFVIVPTISCRAPPA